MKNSNDASWHRNSELNHCATAQNVGTYAKLHGVARQKTVMSTFTTVSILKLKRPVAILKCLHAFLNILLIYYQANGDTVSWQHKYECEMMTF